MTMHNKNGFFTLNMVMESFGKSEPWILWFYFLKQKSHIHVKLSWMEKKCKMYYYLSAWKSGQSIRNSRKLYTCVENGKLDWTIYWFHNIQVSRQWNKGK